MRNVFLSLFFFLMLSLASLGFSRTSAASGPEFYADFKPVVGGWSEYQMTGQAPGKMKVAVVDKEGDAYWFETVFQPQGEDKIVSKMLVSGDPKDQKNVKRMITKAGDEPAMEMPMAMMGQAHGSMKPQDNNKGKMIDKGEESITVPAGTFKAQHIQYQDKEGQVDVWLCKEVSPYGMIKVKEKDMETVLIGHGTGARSQITEKPQGFEIPGVPIDMPEKPVDDEDVKPKRGK